MSYHGTGLGLLRRGGGGRGRVSAPVILNLRTYADVWKDPNPSGEVKTGRFRDLGLPVAWQRQLQAELDARQPRGVSGVGYVEYLDCTPPGGIGTPSTACVDENLRRQQANFAERNADARAGFLADCNRDWKLNDEQYAARGLPRPVNTCDQRSFGITPMGSSGSPVEAPIPVTYMLQPAPAPAPAAAPPPAVVVPISYTPKDALMPAPAPSPAPPVPSTGPAAGGYIDSLLPGVLDRASDGVPAWAIFAAVGAGALFFFGGKR